MVAWQYEGTSEKILRIPGRNLNYSPVRTLGMLGSSTQSVPLALRAWQSDFHSMQCRYDIIMYLSVKRIHIVLGCGFDSWNSENRFGSSLVCCQATIIYLIQDVWYMCFYIETANRKCLLFLKCVLKQGHTPKTSLSVT